MADENQNQQQGEQPKIIVDDDWKAQARAEKEKLAQQVEQSKEAAEGAGAAQGAAGSAGAGGGRGEIPPASFSTLVSTIATQALMSLGGMQDRRTGQRIVDLDLAKHHVDTLSVLEEKTRGNLSDDEKQLLDQALYETRMQYVQIAQQIAGPQ